MVNKQEAKYLRYVSIMTLAVAAFICVVSIACGMPVLTVKPESDTKAIHIIAPTLTAADTPSRSVSESTARACGSLWVREGAGIEYPKIAWALRGDTLTLTGNERKAKDGGQWSQVIDRGGMTGWVNTRFICGGEK